MCARPDRIRVDLEVDGESFKGRASTEDGSARDFTGWLGLVGALDKLLTQPGQEAIEAPQAAQRGGRDPCEAERGETTGRPRKEST